MTLSSGGVNQNRQHAGEIGDDAALLMGATDRFRSSGLFADDLFAPSAHHLAIYLICKPTSPIHTCLYVFIAQPPYHRSSIAQTARVPATGFCSLSRPIALALTNVSEE